MKILLLILLFNLAIGFIIMELRDRRRWNNGVCKKSGLPWKDPLTICHGGTMWVDGCGNVYEGRGYKIKGDKNE